MSSPIQIPPRREDFSDRDSLSDASTTSCSPPDSLTPPTRSYQKDPDGVITNVFLANKLDLFLVQFCDQSSENLQRALINKNPDPLFELPDEEIVRISEPDFIKNLFRASHGWTSERLKAVPQHCSKPILTRLALYRIFHPIDYLSLYHILTPVSETIREVMKHKLYMDNSFKFRYPPPTPRDTSKLIGEIIEQVTPPAIQLYQGAMQYIEETLASRPKIDREVFKSFK
jgi:hypothetical protein